MARPVIAALTWHISRASGLVAWLLLAAAVLWGLLSTSRLLERRPSPAWLLDLHRHLGTLTVALTIVHIGAIWLDDFVDYTVVELLVPLASDEHRIPVALGAVSLWLLVVVQLTSSPRLTISPRRWRLLHLLSAPLLVVATLHGWFVGTDADHPLVVVIALVVSAELVLVGLLRIRYGRRRLDPRPAARGDATPVV